MRGQCAEELCCWQEPATVKSLLPQLEVRTAGSNKDAEVIVLQQSSRHTSSDQFSKHVVGLHHLQAVHLVPLRHVNAML